MSDSVQEEHEFSASVGHDIRALRKSQGLTLEELALQIGRSTSWLSQVERNISQPSISDLRQLAGQFQKPLGFFFINEQADLADRGYVVRAQRRRTLGDGSDGLVETLLSPDLGGEFELFHSRFEPHSLLPKAILRNTEEAGYVVSGSLTLWIGSKQFELATGDSFRFKNEAYRWANKSDEAAIVIWVISPPVY